MAGSKSAATSSLHSLQSLLQVLSLLKSSSTTLELRSLPQAEPLEEVEETGRITVDLEPGERVTLDAKNIIVVVRIRQLRRRLETQNLV